MDTQRLISDFIQHFQLEILDLAHYAPNNMRVLAHRIVSVQKQIKILKNLLNTSSSSLSCSEHFHANFPILLMEHANIFSDLEKKFILYNELIGSCPHLILKCNCFTCPISNFCVLCGFIPNDHVNCSICECRHFK